MWSVVLFAGHIPHAPDRVKDLFLPAAKYVPADVRSLGVPGVERRMSRRQNWLEQKQKMCLHSPTFVGWNHSQPGNSMVWILNLNSQTLVFPCKCGAVGLYEPGLGFPTAILGWLTQWTSTRTATQEMNLMPQEERQ